MILSVIVPSYNEEESLPLFFAELDRYTEKFRKAGVEFEIIPVDDGSRDKTLEVIRGLEAKDSRVRGISFSRNFGKEAAILAGLEGAKGDLLVLMDADLQDPPALLYDLFEAITKEGYDSAATRRVTRKGEPPIRSFFARSFYKLINKISVCDIVDGARDYRMMTREFANAVLSLSEKCRFTKGIFGFVGFKTKWFEYENIERAAGETKWSFFKLFRYALEGIYAFSTAALAVPLWTGALALIASVVLFCLSLPLYGTVCLAASLTCFSIYPLCAYTARMYTEIKARPVYIIKDHRKESDNKK